MTEQLRRCGGCKGSGHAYHWDHEKEAGQPPRPCYTCRGAGTMPAPDRDAILAAVKGRKGLCSKRPADPRAYFVWRMARFHGGRDVTMPITASMSIHGDPWEKELDDLASAVAKQAFGTDMAAAHRWGHALGMLPAHVELPGLPATAYPSGPVLSDGDKPEEEMPELF